MQALIKGNDLKGNTFRFLCTKFTEGASIEAASSVRIAAFVIIPMEQRTNMLENIRDASHIP